MIWLLVACSVDVKPARVSSVPSEPAVELGGEALAEPTVVWTDIEGMFEEGRVGLPKVLAGLEPGSNGATARDVLMKAQESGTPISAEVKGNHMVLQTSMTWSDTDVGVALILDEAGSALQEVDLSLPDVAAMVVLRGIWGEPEEGPPLKDGRTFYQWKGSPWNAQFHRVGNGRAVVKFQASNH